MWEDVSIKDFGSSQNFRFFLRSGIWIVHIAEIRDPGSCFNLWNKCGKALLDAVEAIESATTLASAFVEIFTGASGPRSKSWV